MAKRQYMTTDYFFERIKDNPNYPNMDILTKEIHGGKTRIKCKCKVCTHEWETNVEHLVYGKTGCPKCKGTLKITNDEFLTRMKEMHPLIVPLDNYVNNSTKISLYCTECTNVWKAKPSHLFDGHGCPVCGAIKNGLGRTKKHDDFVDEMKSLNANIQIIGKYTNSQTHIKCKCLICGETWDSKPNNLLNGYGCPICATSKGEQRIAEFLDSLDIQYERQKKFSSCKNKKELPFDFYISKYNIAIEYDGKQHFEPVDWGFHDEELMIANFDDLQKRDGIKNKYCEDNGIKLIRIPYTEFDNIEMILSENLN